MADFNKFNFIGKLGISKETNTFKPYSELNNAAGWQGKRLQFNIKADKSIEFLELMGGINTKIYSKTKSYTDENGVKIKSEDLIIDWNDRNKQEIIDQVANFKKIIVDLNPPRKRYDLKIKYEKLNDKSLSETALNELIDDIVKEYGYNIEQDGSIKEYVGKLLKEAENKRKEFLTEADAIDFLREMIPKTENKIFNVKGSWTWSEYKGVFREKFTPQYIALADGEKERFKGECTIYFNKESLDDSIFKETKKYIINGYTLNYDSRLKKEVFIPVTFSIDGSKIDFENDKQVKRLEFLKNIFKVRGKKYYKVKMNTILINGSEKKEIALEDLTDFEREQVELGFITLEEIQKEHNGTYGDKITETKLISLHKESRQGIEETEYKDEDFVIATTEDESIDDVIKNNEKDNEVKEDVQKSFDDLDVDDEDLFG